MMLIAEKIGSAAQGRLHVHGQMPHVRLLFGGHAKRKQPLFLHVDLRFQNALETHRRHCAHHLPRHVRHVQSGLLDVVPVNVNGTGYRIHAANGSPIASFFQLTDLRLTLNHPASLPVC